MRIISFLSVLFLTFLFMRCSKSSSSDVDLNKGLLAYYPFNGNANDQSSYHLDGKIENGVTFTEDVSGKANSAVTFDGTSGYILVQDSNSILAPDVVSVSFLVNLTDVTNRSALINKVDINSSFGLSYGINVSSPTTNQKFNFGIVPNGFDCSSSNYDLNNIIDNGTAIGVNKWYHVVAIFSDSSQKLYVNGALTTSDKRNFGNLNKCSSNKSFLMGGWWQGDIISLHGSLDEVRVYNRELNQDEITELARPVVK
jgi:hypothetical protein